jgi:hypothetical protein
MLKLIFLCLDLSQHRHELLVDVLATVGQKPVQDVFVEHEVFLKILDLALKFLYQGLVARIRRRHDAWRHRLAL